MAVVSSPSAHSQRTAETEEERDDKINMVPFPPPFSKKVKRICLTGGPCGGKTTALSQVATRLRSMGIQVFVVPENATTFSSAGVGFPANGTPQQQRAWECAKLRVQMTMEDCFVRIAQASSRTSVIVFDRGCMDTKAYCSEAMWQAVLESLGVTERELCTERYDAVVHLVTTALGAESYYSTQNNTARRETLQEAREVDAETRKAWAQHPHVRIIDNPPGGMKAKTQGVVSEVCRLLGVQCPRQRRLRLLIDPALPAQIASLDWVSKYLDEFLVEITFLDPSSALCHSFLRRRVKRTDTVGDTDVFVLCTRTQQPIGTPPDTPEQRVMPAAPDGGAGRRAAGEGSTPPGCLSGSVVDVPAIDLGPARTPLRRRLPGSTEGDDGSCHGGARAESFSSAAAAAGSPTSGAGPAPQGRTPLRAQRQQGEASLNASLLASPATPLLLHCDPAALKQRIALEERPLTKREYDKLLTQQADPGCAQLTIRRRCFCYKQHWFQLDHYPRVGLVLLDVEVHDLDSRPALPKWLEPHVQRRVTGTTLDAQLQAFNIAKHLAELPQEAACCVDDLLAAPPAGLGPSPRRSASSTSPRPAADS